MKCSTIFFSRMQCWHMDIQILCYQCYLSTTKNSEFYYIIYYELLSFNTDNMCCFGFNFFVKFLFIADAGWLLKTNINRNTQSKIVNTLTDFFQNLGNKLNSTKLINGNTEGSTMYVLHTIMRNHFAFSCDSVYARHSLYIK